jgi:glycogen synthase
MMQDALRIVYLSGPVDGVDAFNRWKAGRKLAYFGASHLTNFFELCSNLGATAYVITTLGTKYGCYRAENFVIENRPQPTQFKGIYYHVANAFWLIKMLPTIFRFRPDVIVITAAQNYWFLLAVLKLRHVKIIPAITCTLWPQFTPLRPSLKILLWFNTIFFRHCVDAVQAVSGDIAAQVRKLLEGRIVPITTFLPTYPRSQFSSFGSADFSDRPFRILFSGRIETNKGIYDLVQVAATLDKQAPQQFYFDICGDGSELEALRRHIADLDMASVIACHGFCNHEKLSFLLQASHVVIVPTTTKFEEGFNKVCAEAILAGRPVVTSAVCPALAYVKAAAIEVPPDDVSAYCEAIFALSNDRELYEQKRRACKTLQDQFYDSHNSWGAKLRELLEKVLPEARMTKGDA